MGMEYTGIAYFPLRANFFEEEIPELLEAKFGIRASYILARLLCKIYKEGYYTPWGKEQSIIFLRKTGGEVKEETMTQIMELLLEKGFFNQKSYEEHGILTSEEIQRVWLEATARRKRDLDQLPYLLVTSSEAKREKSRQKKGVNEENVSNSPVQGELNLENAGNSEQSKVKESRVDKEEEETNCTSFKIPGYAYNKATHNVSGLVESLEHHKVTDPKELQTILRLSDYGKKETPVWRLFPNTNWSKIAAPGKYIIAVLTSGRKQAD